MTRPRGTFLGYRGCTPEHVGEDLGRALATLLCRERHRGTARPCPDCAAAGRTLAKPVARALVAMAEAYRRGPLMQQDYQTVGRVLEELEVVAGTRGLPNGRRCSPR